MSENANEPKGTQTRARLKSAGIIFVTLILGMVLGGLVTARIVQNRIDDVAALRSEGRFTHFIERSIEFESPEQKEQVSEILDRTADRMFDHLRDSRREARSILDSARTELSGILSDEQMEQLEKRLRQRRFGGPHNGPGPRGRRPGDPPPRGPRP